MLRAIAIDDEPIALEIVRSHAAKIPFLEMKGSFTNAFDALDYLKDNSVDLIFLDIKMPDISGIDFLQALTRPPMVIFTTAYSAHAVQSFELDAIDYLLKPFSAARFLKACTKAHEQWRLKKNENAESGASAIFIKTGVQQVRVPFDDILYVESNGNYMEFILKDRKVVSRLTMKEVEAILPGASFLRIHRSFIVSKNQVVKIDRNDLWVGTTQLPIGAAYEAEVEKITAR